MKTFNVLVIFLILFGTGSTFAQRQTIPVYPIPSNNITVDGLADFENLHVALNNNERGKWTVHIHFIANTPEQQGCEASVIVYSLDGTKVLGPYTVSCGQTLDVEIDSPDWGVIVDSDVKLTVDVWITAG